MCKQTKSKLYAARTTIGNYPYFEHDTQKFRSLQNDSRNAKLAQQKCDNERCCDVAACELMARDAMTNSALEKVWEPTRAENRRRKQRSVYDRKELVYTKNLAPKLKEKY
jgi:hypothetical protein